MAADEQTPVVQMALFCVLAGPVLAAAGNPVPVAATFPLPAAASTASPITESARPVRRVTLLSGDVQSGQRSCLRLEPG
jgi:hypothetical protein